MNRLAPTHEQFAAGQQQRTISGARNVQVGYRTRSKREEARLQRQRMGQAKRALNTGLSRLKNKDFVGLVDMVLDEETPKRDIVDYLKLNFNSIEQVEELVEQYGDFLDERTRGLIGKALLAWKYYKITILNRTILGWSLPVYVLQLKLAAISLAALGLAGVVDAALTYIDQEVPGGDWVVQGLQALNGAVGSFWSVITDIIQELFDVSLPAGFDIEGLLVVSIILPFLVGLFMLFTMSYLYVSTFTRCFHGKAAGLKSGLFMMAIFGYFTPILNLLPWFLPWMIAVWRYPK